MATEAETSEPIAAKKMEGTENICSQFGKVVNKASLEESMEVEDGCSFPSGTVDYSTRNEGLEEAQSLKNGIVNLNTDGKFSSLENDSSLESSSPAREDSAEIPKASQDNVDRIKPILIKTKALENERIDVKDKDVSEQLEKDKPRTETDDMKELAPEMKHEELDFEPTNADDSMGGNPIEQIMERLAGQYEDIKEQEVSPDHSKTIGGEPIEDVPEDKVTEEDVREPTIEKDVVTDHSKTTIKKEPTKDGNKENEVVEGLEIVGAEDIGVPVIKEKDVPDLSTPTIVDEPTQSGQEDDTVSDGLELAGSELTREKDVPFHGRTTIGEEPNNNGDEVNKVTEELKTVGEDTYINEPTIKEDAIPEYSTKSVGEESMKDDHEVEKVIEGSDIVAADKDMGEPTMEEYVIPDNSTTTIQEKPIEDGYKEEKVTVGLETPAADKNIGEPIKEEDVVPEHSKTTITEDSHEEEKVTKGLEVAGAGKDIKEPIIDEKVALDNSTTITWEESIKDGDEKYKISEAIETDRGEEIGETLIKEDVPKHSTTVEEEQVNGGHEEDKVNEGFKIVDEGKDIVEPMIEDDVVQSHSTPTTKDEPTEGSQEDKIVNKPEVTGSNKDIEEPIIKNDVLESSMKCIDKKSTENADKEDKIIEGLETTGKDKDVGEPIIKKDAILDHSTTISTEKLIQETNNDDKKMERSETSDANKETDNPIIEEDVLPEQPTTTTGQELFNDDEEKYKVTEGLEIPHAYKDIGEPIKEENVVAHSTTTIKEEPIEDGHEEDKVIKGLQVAGAGKDIMEPIINEDFVPDHYTTAREEEPIKDSPGKDMVIKESKIIDVEKDFGEPITEKYVPEPYTTNIEEEQTEDDHEDDKVPEGQETTSANKDGGETVIQDSVQDHSATSIREQPTEHNQEEDEIMHEPIIISADKDFGDSIKDKYVPEPSATTNEGERFKDDHEEDKVIEAQETTSPDKDSGEPVIEEDVQDHSTTIITEQPTEDSQEEDQIINVSKIIGADKDLENPITDKYVPDPSTTVIEGKRTKDDHEQHKVIEGQETTSADKDIGEPIIEEGVQDHSKTTVTEQPTDDSQEEDQIINQSKIIDADKDFGDSITAKNVPEPSTTTTIEGEQTKDDHEQDKAIEGQETTSADKESGEPVREKGVQDHSTTTIGEQPTEESQEEDQIMHETKIIGADKDFGDPIKDKYVPEPSATTNEGERTEDGHEEDKVSKAQETSSPEKDSGEPVIEEGVQDQSTTTITEQPTEDSQEDLMNDVSKIIGANKGYGDPITDKYVPEPSTAIIEGKRTENDHEQDKVTEGQETTSADKDSEEPIVEEGVQDHSKTTLREQPTEDSQEDDQIIIESKIIDADGDPITAKKILEPSTTIIEGGRPEDNHEENKVSEAKETTCADVHSGEPVREKSVQDHSTTIAKEQSIEDNQEDKESQLFGAEKDFGDQIIEKCFPEPSTTTIEDEQTEEDKIRAIKGQETTSADKDSGEPIIEEGVQDHSTTTIREQPTKDSQEEDKGSKVIGTDKDFGDRITEKYVPELYTTTIEEEGIIDADGDPITAKKIPESSTTIIEGGQPEDDHEEDKVNEGQETTCADVDSGEPVREKSVQEHSTTIAKEQSIEDNQEDKDSQIFGAEKDFGDQIIEKYFPEPSTTTIEDEQTEEDKFRAIKVQEATSADKDSGEPIIEEGVQDYSTTTIREQPTKDSQEDKGSKAIGTDKDFGDRITEKYVPELYTTTIEEERTIDADGDPITAKKIPESSTTIIEGGRPEDDHEEDKVNKGQETKCADVDSGEPVREKSVQDHSTTIAKEQSIEDNQEDKTFGADKDFGDQIIEKKIPEPSATTIEDEQTEEDKIRAIKGQETTSANKESGEPIIEEGVQDHSTTTIREQPTKDSHEEDTGSKVIGTDKDFGDRTTEKYVPELYTTTVEEERTEDGYEEDKVIEGQETTNADKDSGETVVEEGVQFNSTTSIREQPTEDCQEEDKIIKGSKTIDLDKDFGDSIRENYAPNPSATTIEDEQTEDDREEDQIAGQETTSEDKETGDPIIEKDVVPDHSTTVIREELIQDANVDDKIKEGSETSGANEVTGNPIIEDDVLEHSTSTIGQELVKDIHEEDKVSEGLETAGAKEDAGKPIIEDDISEHSTTATWEEPIKHGGEEDKVHNELKVVSGDEAKDTKILEDDAIDGLYQKSSGEEKTKNTSQEYEVGKEHAVTEAGMEVEQITENATIADLPTVIEKEVTEGNLEDKSEAEKQKGETKEFVLSMKSISESSDSTPKEDKINFQDEEKQHMNLHPDSVSDARVGEIVQKENSQDLNDTSTELNFGTTGMTDKIETENIKKEENLDKSQDADSTKETSQEELIQKESSETFDEASSLVPLASEEQLNEKIVEYLEGIDDCQHNPSLTEEKKGSSSNATESEDAKLVEQPEGLYIGTSVNNFRTNTYENEQGYTKNLEETSMDKTIQTEVIDNGEDQWTQNREVAAFGDPASTEQNLKSLNLTGETEHLAVVGQHKHADDSDTIHKLLEEPAKGVLETKIYGEDVDMSKVEEHSAESFEMSKEPEFEMLSDKEKIIDEEITLIQKSETKSMQTIATEESGFTKELGYNNLEHDDIEAKTNKEQHSDVIFYTDAMESDITSGKTIVEAGDDKDQNNTFSRDDEDGKSWIDDKKEQTDTELEPVMEVEAEIHTTGVRPGTSAEIRNEEVCDEHGRADITATAKVKGDCILRDIDSVHNEEETISMSHEKDQTDPSNLGGKIQPELWYADKEISQDAKGNPRTAGEVTVSENSHKDEKVSKYQKAEVSLYTEVFESPELAGDSRDAVVIDKNDVDENHFTLCVGQEVVQQSLKKDEQEKTEKEMHERLDATGDDKADDKQKLPVLPAEQASTEYSPESEVYEELEAAAAEEGARYKSMGNGAGTKIPAELVGEQTTNLSSQETKMETNTQGAVRESELASIIEETASTTETEMVTQDDEKYPEKSHKGFIDAEAPLEEITKMESSDKLNYTSAEFAISEEQIMEKTSEKTENTDKHYQITVAMPLTEKLSVHEAKPEGKDLVNVTDLSAIEMFATTFEKHEASSQDINVEDVKLREISNFDGSLIDHMLAAENSEKDEAEQEKSDQAEQENFEIPVETAAQIVQSEEKDIKTLPCGEIISRKSSSDDILEGKAHESPVSVSDKQDTIGMEPEIKHEAPTEGETIDKKIGAYLVVKGEGEKNMKAEECTRHEENSEMRIENKEKKVSIPEFCPEYLLTEPKDDDVILDTENIVELKPINENIKIRTQIPSLEENKAGNEESFCTFSDKLETIDTYAKTETYMLGPEENHVKKLDQNLEESKKETVEIEETILEVEAMEHSEEINESNSTTTNLTLLQNLKAVDPCEKFRKATESVDRDQSNEPLLETEKSEVVKDQVIVNDQTAIIVDSHTIGQSIQDVRENKNLNEERSNDNSDVNKPIKDTILNEEMQHRIENAQKSESIEEEADKKIELVDKEIAKENAEAVFPEEKIEPTQLENLEKIIDNIHITHSSAKEAFLESCDQYKDASEGSVKCLDTISVGDGTVEESSPDQKGKGVKEASCESKDDQKQECAEVNQIMDKETLADEFGSSGMVLLECDIKEDLSDKTQTVLVTNCKDRTRKLDDPPIKIASYEGETMEVSKHLEEESDLPITKMSENRTEPKSETGPEDFLGIENSSDLAVVASIMSSKETLHTGEELPINKRDTSCLTEASQQEMQGKEGHGTEDEMEIIEKPIKEMSLSTEESGKNVKHETPLAEMPKECAEKTNELNIQERICTNEEGETQVRQLDTPDEMAEKQISLEVDSIVITDKKNPISGKEIPSMPVSPVKKSLEKTEVYEENHADAQVREQEMNNVECEADERKHNLVEKTTADLHSSEEEKVPFLDLLHESKRATQEMVGELEDGTSQSNQAEIGNKEILTAATSEEQITDENDEEGKEREEDDGEKKDDSGSDAPVMVEASRDIVVKTTPKKSHNILSGVGSKVKHSISKVKKAITGKSSHHKQLSPK